MKRNDLVVLVAAVLGVGLLVPEVAEAQYGYGYRPQPRPQARYMNPRHRLHGYVGGQVMGMGMLAQGVESADFGYIGPGGGIGLYGGVRLSPWIGLELNWTFTGHDEEWSCGHDTCVAIDALNIQTLTADFKLHIPTRGPIEPFFQAGGGFAFLGVTGDWASDGYIFNSGPTFSIGGGADWWLNPWFTVGGRILYRGMYFTSEDPYTYRDGSQDTRIDRHSNYVSGISVDLNAQIHF